jgi:hypothetical protein
LFPTKAWANSAQLIQYNILNGRSHLNLASVIVIALEPFSKGAVLHELTSQKTAMQCRKHAASVLTEGIHPLGV